MARILIGVAWPYANGPLHLGHVAGCYLPADIFARYQRLAGNEVLMVSGSDMHGTPITVTAEAEGTTPEVIAHRYHELHSECMERMGISFDLYTHTATEEHRVVVHELFERLRTNGYIIPRTQEAPYCASCDRFLPDRYLEGTCPHSGSQEARGDQCDGCGKAYEANELEAPRCKLSGDTPEWRETEHLYLALSKLEPQLHEWLSAGKEHWRDNVLAFTRNWMAEGLHDRAITRDLSWGIEVPYPGYEAKRIYVWFEAVMGYHSASRTFSEQSGEPDLWRGFWEDPKARSYYFLAKDNIPFHTIIWPAILLGAGGLNLPHDVPANEYLLLDQSQFSKSRGHLIGLPDFLKRYDPELLRFYLTANMPESRDASFTWADFVTRVNNELVATLGNLIHRVLSFTHSRFGTVQAAIPWEPELEARANQAHKSITQALEACHFKEAWKALMELAHYGNQYLDQAAPWKLAKEDPERCREVLVGLCNLTRALSLLMAPFLPNAAARVWQALGQGDGIEEAGWSRTLETRTSFELKDKPLPLFGKLDLEAVLKAEGVTGAKGEDEGARESDGVGASASASENHSKSESETMTETTEIPDVKDQINFDEFLKLDLRVGTVTTVKSHPKADKLYVLQVDFGGPTRQLVAGLRPHYKPEEMKGKQIVVAVNLKPARLRGVRSEGMLLAAEDGQGRVRLLTPEAEIDDGAGVK